MAAESEYTSFLELARRRQSIRTFSERTVPTELIDKVLAAALEAPTSCNHQLNRFVVVTDQAIKERLCTEAGCPNRIRLAPVAVVLLFRMGWNHNKLSVAQSLGMAAQNLLLAATSCGLASVIQAGIGDTDRIRMILDIPDGCFVAAIVSLGFAADSGPRPPRLEVDQVTGRERFHQDPALDYPRRRQRTAFGDYSNARSPDAEWRPDRWPLASIARFRGLAVWHTSPSRDVHRSRRWRAEHEAEVDLCEREVGEAASVLEVLSYSGAHGAALAARRPERSWDVFELSPHHRPFILKRCQLEGVTPPRDFLCRDRFDIDRDRRWPAIVVPGGLNHLPLSAELRRLLVDHLEPGGRLVVFIRNSWSFQTPLYWRQRRGQVWNFGPFVPRRPNMVERWLAPELVLRREVGLSLTPWSIGEPKLGWTRRLCRTVCQVFEAP